MKLLVRLAIAGLLAVTLPEPAHAARTAPASKSTDAGIVVAGPVAARIDSFMTAATDYGMEGTLLVERDGKVILHRGYGIVDRARGRPATTRTPYILGSLSKQFTAAAIYKLESQGRLHVGDSLAQWFPDVPADKRGITIDQLIHHTSGLPYLNRGDMYDSISVDSMVRETFTYPLLSPPGAKYAYSSPGYDLLGAIVARASGRPFDAYVRSEIFEPAGMRETGFVDEPERWPEAQRTPSYSSPDPDPPLYPARLAPKIMGSGNVISTTGDLWKWEQALRTNRVLDAETTRKIFTPGPPTGPTSAYAGGWQVVRSQRNTTVILHQGDLGGFNTDMRRLVDEHATIIFLSNAREGGRGYRDAIPILVTRILFGPEPVLPRAPARLAKSALRRWSGTVSVAPGVPVEGAVRDDAVWLTARTQEGMFALAGSDSAARAQALAFRPLAERAASELAAGHEHALDSLFSPSLVESSHPEFFRAWKSVIDSLGGNARVEVIGTVVSPPADARSLVRVTGVKGTRVMTLDWLAGGLIQSVPIASDGLELRFYPESEETLTRYDLWAARLIRVSRSG